MSQQLRERDRTDPPAPPRLELARPASDAAAIELRGIVKRWRRRDEPVLDGVDLEVGRGSVIRVTGRNGAGKTTLLRIAAGLIGAERGVATVDGLRASPRHHRDYRARIGLLTAGSTGLYARLSVRRHLDLWARLALLPPDGRAPAVERALDEFMLGELASQRVDRISMGQRQRARLAMAFLHRPLVALLDEPTTSLDDIGAELLSNAVRGLCDRGGAVIWCCPTGDAPAVHFDRTYVLDGGALQPQTHVQGDDREH
jgi:ABC-type multidrug transport system ATPase subunit